MAKITVKERPSKDGSSDLPLYIRISHKRSTRYVSLGIKVHKKHWNASSSAVRKGHPEHEKLNTYLQRSLSQAQSALLARKTSGQAFTADDLKSDVELLLKPGATSKGEGDDFLHYAEGLAQDYARRGQLATADNHRIYLRKLRSFVESRGRKGLAFGEITPELLRGFQAFLSERYQNGANTIAKNMKDLRADVYTAIREGRVSQGANPFFHVSIKEERTRKRALTLSEIQALRELELPGEEAAGQHGGRLKGVPRSALLRDVRNAFIFATYAQGMRWADLATLRWEALRAHEEGARLSYVMRKNGKFIDMLLPRPAWDVLSVYQPRRGRFERVFPALDGETLTTEELARRAIGRKLSLYNKYLKKLAERAGIETRLTFHIARHTFASMALDLGFDVRDLNAALRHGTLRTTELYIEDLKQSRLDEKMRLFE